MDCFEVKKSFLILRLITVGLAILLWSAQLLEETLSRRVPINMKRTEALWPRIHLSCTPISCKQSCEYQTFFLHIYRRVPHSSRCSMSGLAFPGDYPSIRTRGFPKVYGGKYQSIFTGPRSLKAYVR